MTLAEIVAHYYDAEILVADGFDSAVIAYEPRESRLVYDRNKMALLLMSRDKMKEDEAWEYLEYNVFSAYVGENTPLFIETKPWESPYYHLLAVDKDDNIIEQKSMDRLPNKKQLKSFLKKTRAAEVQYFCSTGEDFEIVGVQK